MCAMLRIESNQRLKSLGFRQVPLCCCLHLACVLQAADCASTVPPSLPFHLHAQVLQVHDEIILEASSGSSAPHRVHSLSAIHCHASRTRCMTLVTVTCHTLLQGPSAAVDEAQAIVKALMERPLPQPLLVDLTVDIKHADTWYEAK